MLNYVYKSAGSGARISTRGAGRARARASARDLEGNQASRMTPPLRFLDVIVVTLLPMCAAPARGGAAARAAETLLTQACHPKDGGPPTDKFSGGAFGNSYASMYSMLLMPFVGRSGGASVKMLEIGLGCTMNYGPGRSAHLWRELMPAAEIWEAEVDGACVHAKEAELRKININTLVGSAGDAATRHSWLAKSGGGFDIIIDDGSHHNGDILSTFIDLWPHVLPGGVYFLEDLQAGRHAWYTRDGTPAILDVIHGWNEQLTSGRRPLPPSPTNQSDSEVWKAGYLVQQKARETVYGPTVDDEGERHARRSMRRYPLPNGVAYIMCQSFACAIGKELDGGMQTCPKHQARGHGNQGVGLRQQLRDRISMGVGRRLQ